MGEKDADYSVCGCYSDSNIAFVQWKIWKNDVEKRKMCKADDYDVKNDDEDSLSEFL